MNTEPSLKYQEYSPCPDVAPYVASYWSFDVAPDGNAVEHTIIPDGCISLAFRAVASGLPAELRVVGPRATSFSVMVHPGDHYFGIRFWPDAGGAALRADATTLRNQVGPARLLGERALPLTRIMRSLETCADSPARCAACDTALPDLLRDAAPIDATVRGAVVLTIAFDGDISIGTLQQRLGIGVRQLQRRFRAAVGLTMKEFARIRRVRATAATLLASDVHSTAQLAARAGFSDQAHLIRELVRVTGSPTTPLRARLGRILHTDIRV
jgi:AraC-like DNA-binding protein